MSVKVTNTIKRVIGVIAIIITLGAMLYGFASNNYTLTISIILVIRFFVPLLRVSNEE